MAQEIIIKVSAQLDQVSKAVDDTKEKVADIGKAVEKNTEAVKKGNVAVKKLTKGFKGMGLALKAAGLKLALEAFDFLKDALFQNQKAVDFFSTAFNAASIIVSDFINLIFGNFDKIGEFFDYVFSVQALKDFGQAIVDNVIERFQSLLDMFGALGDAAVKLFQGDFAGVAESLKEAGSELVDSWTGVDNSLEKIGNGIAVVTEKVAEYGAEVIKTAQAQTDLANASRIALAENEKLLQQYDYQAETLRQIRDDENRTIEERIEANRKLGELLDEQERIMLENAQMQLDAAQAKLALDANNVDAIEAVIMAERDLADVQATVAGFRSEQLINEVSLIRERNDLLDEYKAKLDEELEVYKDQQNQITEALLSAQELEEKAIYDKYDALLNAESATNEQIKALREKREQELAAIETKYDKKKTDEKIANREKYAAIADTLAQSSFNLVSGLFEEGSAQAKAFAVAETIWNTASAIINMLTAKPAGPQNFVLAGIAAATGAAQIAKILSTDVSSSESGGSAPQAPSPAPVTSANLASNNLPNQLATAFNSSQQNAPLRAYVVSGEVSTQQALDRKVLQNATFK